MSSALYQNLRLADGRCVDLRAASGLVDAVAPRLAPRAGEPVVNAGGALALPALTYAHAHLDKTLTGLRWLAHLAGPDRASRIETERRLRPTLPMPVEERAARLLERCIGFGTTALRTHVDVDADIGIAHVKAIARLRERYADRLVLDGAQTFEHDKAHFHRAAAPRPGELEALLDTLIRRITRTLVAAPGI